MYYSVKMRASQDGAHENGGKHISGAERIVNLAYIPEVCKELSGRAITHENGLPDFINIKVELLKSDDITYCTSLPIIQVKSESAYEGEKAAKYILEQSGISRDVIQQSWQYLIDGGINDQQLRGALVVDGQSGEIYNPDFRGIRATRMDLIKEAEGEINKFLKSNNLAKSRIKEALVLATKVVAAPNAWCELCFSDNLQYTTGYVTVKNWGYFRIPNLKPRQAKGGRVFLVNGQNFSWQKYYNFLTKTPVLINKINRIFYQDVNIFEFEKFNLGEGISCE